jgi:hypothetical protein
MQRSQRIFKSLRQVLKEDPEAMVRVTKRVVYSVEYRNYNPVHLGSGYVKVEELIQEYDENQVTQEQVLDKAAHKLDELYGPTIKTQ